MYFCKAKQNFYYPEFYPPKINLHPPTVLIHIKKVLVQTLSGLTYDHLDLVKLYQQINFLLSSKM